MEDHSSPLLIPPHPSRGNSRKGADKVYSKIGWRILPALLLTTAVCYVDRTNISLAAINMSKDLDISKTQYGTAASIFFATYVIFQIPSNMVLRKVGGPIWLGTLLVGWGIVASLTALVHNVWQLYLMRLLLGVFEAGTFPGAWYYTSIFFPEERMPFAASVVNAGIVVGLCISAPLAGGLLSMHGLLSFSGWQWLFFLEGIPPVLLGVFVMFYLPKLPSSGKFLSADEQAILKADRCVTVEETAGLKTIAEDIVLNAGVWVNVVAWILLGISKYATHFWTPLWIHSLAQGAHGDDGEQTGRLAAFLSAIPFVFAAVATILVGWSSERLGDRKYHMAVAVSIGGIIFCVFPSITRWGSLLGGIVALTLLQCAVSGADGVKVGLCMVCMKNESKSFGIAWCNALGNLSGLIGPYMVGALVDQTGSYDISLYLAGAILFLAAIFYLVARDEKNH